MNIHAPAGRVVHREVFRGVLANGTPYAVSACTTRLVGFSETPAPLTCKRCNA